MTLFESSNLRVEGRPDGIALLRLDVAGRSLNVFNRQVLADLSTALDHIAADPTLRLLVIRSDKTSGFLAGADLREFATVATAEEGRALAAAGQELFAKLAALRLPTIALIHGACLGGGLEFALACDYRLVLDHPKTQLGLPEVELGLLPAWGGTQRLPRVVGLERALRVILGGHRLGPQEAQTWGLADALGATEPQLAAQLSLWIDKASRQGKRPRKGLPLRSGRQRLLESTRLGRALLFRGAERALRRRVPEDMPAPGEALQAVRLGLAQGMEAGLAYEREAAGRLVLSSACRNLVQIFLRREEVRKVAEQRAGAAPEVRQIGVVGVGVMGAGIAQLAAVRGLDVVVQEVNDAALAAGMERIAALFQKAVERRLLTPEAAGRKQDAIGRTTQWERFARADLVIEAVVEDLELKERVFREMERHTRLSAILATNTSSLPVGQIQKGLEHRERMGGLHFFNPVHKMPLVEVVRGPGTGEQAIAGLLRGALALGKTPVIVRDSPGFLVNRILMPYLYEAVVLAVQGVAVSWIDETMRRFGMPMGPLELLDQVGLDVATHSARSLEPLFRERLRTGLGLERLAQGFEAMARRGWLGQKTGLGFYRWRGKVKKVHAAALAMLPRDVGPEAAQALAGLPPAVQMREARERLVLAMVNEAAACLGEELAADAATIDLALVLGTGWAPHRGGPLHYADERGLGEVVQRLQELAQRLGPRFEPCVELRRRAALGQPFQAPGLQSGGLAASWTP